MSPYESFAHEPPSWKPFIIGVLKSLDGLTKNFVLLRAQTMEFH